VASFVFDYLDGMAARALTVSSPLGKELDSLADVVSFGVVPGAMLYQMLSCAPAGQAGVVMAALPAFVLSAFSGLRLGKFNLDTRQTQYFLGLSTPASTVLVLGLALSVHHDRFGMAGIISGNPWVLYLLIAALCTLLISEIPMFGMKIKFANWKDNAVNVFFVVLFAVLFLLLKELALTVIIVLYILISVIFRKKVTG
jgi:CDP-diacylglycerol--serine O-phosphatidyltransferase